MEKSDPAHLYCRPDDTVAGFKEHHSASDDTKISPNEEELFSTCLSYSLQS